MAIKFEVTVSEIGEKADQPSEAIRRGVPVARQTGAGKTRTAAQQTAKASRITTPKRPRRLAVLYDY
jgi:hypothetical protein